MDSTGPLDVLHYLYPKAILNHEIPLAVGGGIGQPNTYMLLLRKAHLGECGLTVWTQILKDIRVEEHIRGLE